MSGHEHHDNGGHGHGHQHGHGGHGHEAGHVMFDTPEMAERVEREGEVLIDLARQAADRIAALCAAQGIEVRRILDLGSGPGVGTGVLAERFPAASLVAADGSDLMVERAAARLRALGHGSRVATRRIELPGDLATLEPADLVWASLVIHHIGDEADSLRRIRPLVEPGGLLAVVERALPARVLPDSVDLGRPGLWERLDAAWAHWFAGMRADLPGHTASAGYPEMLAAAGFEVLVDEVLFLTLDPPLGEVARRHARTQLERARQQLTDQADPADLAALDTLLDDTSPDGIAHRPDVQLRASRHLFIARNPG